MNEAYAPAVEHTWKVFKTAYDALGKFIACDLTSFPNVTYGSSRIFRRGDYRKICYVELSDGSGPTLRIEIFTV